MLFKRKKVLSIVQHTWNYNVLYTNTVSMQDAIASLLWSAIANLKLLQHLVKIKFLKAC